MNVLLVNLTRFGDLLQMQPVILGLNAQGHKVGLVCLQNFAPATKLLRGLSHIYILPGGALLAQLDMDWRSALQYMDESIAQVVSQFPVDKILNTTATIGARLLSMRMAMAYGNVPVEGFALDEYGYGKTGDIWSIYLQGASANRLACPFNLVDLFRAIAGVEKSESLWGLEKVETDIERKAQIFLQDLLAEHGVDAEKVKGFVAFQLGASDVRRQWPVEYFAQLGALLWEHFALCPVLLGTASEQGLATGYMEAARQATNEYGAKALPAAPHINAIGRTDILLLAATLMQMRMLITNDTGTMHLAAGLAIPIVAIFLATAQACDTGPYMPNCCCLEPALPCHPCDFSNVCVQKSTSGTDATHSNSRTSEQHCLHRISAKSVFTLAKHYLQHGFWPEHVQNETRVWRTAQDAAGFATLETLSDHANEERSLWLNIQKHFYRRIFDDTFCEEFSWHVPISSSLVEDATTTLRQSTALLHLLEQQLRVFLQKPREDTGTRILMTKNKIQLLFEHSNTLKTLAYLWQNLTQEKGDDIAALMLFVAHFRQSLCAWHDAMCTENA